jgi:hypothetical protein
VPCYWSLEEEPCLASSSEFTSGSTIASFLNLNIYTKKVKAIGTLVFGTRVTPNLFAQDLMLWGSFLELEAAKVLTFSITPTFRS